MGSNKKNEKKILNPMVKYSLYIASAAIGIGLLYNLNSSGEEKSLMAELGSPPPWPIFIAINLLADTLRKLADKLTPPQITMLADIGNSHHKIVLAYIIQKYKIADFIGDGNGPKTVNEIAQFTKTKNVDYVERFMYACAAQGMFKLVDEKTFANTGLSAVLRRDHPNSMAGMIGHSFEDLYQAWGQLPKVFGPDGSDVPWNLVNPNFPVDHSQSKLGIWDFYAKNPKSEEQFSRAMTSLEGIGGQAMAEDGPFENHARFIDIGGSKGHFLEKILKIYGKYGDTDTKGVLFDRAPVVDIARQSLDPELVEQKRVTFHAGDFFDAKTIPDFQDDDCVFLRYILHDWNDEDTIRILSNIRSKIGNKKVTVLIGESAMPNRDSIGQPATIHDIDMTMMVLFGAAPERYPKYWAKLLEKSRFKLASVHSTRSILAWIKAIPI